MQRAAAATMPTTMPVVLLLSRTTSDGPGNTFPSGSGGRAVKRGGEAHAVTSQITVCIINLYYMSG